MSSPKEQSSVAKGKRKADEVEDVQDEAENDDDGEESVVEWHKPAQEGDSGSNGVARNGDWEAIYSTEYSAYYFHNTKTKETTWANPITTDKEAAPTKAVDKSKQSKAVLGGVDPELAYLDPTLSAALNASSASTTPSAYAAQGRFNARTGKFEGDPTRNPDFVSDFARAKRQSSIYFDVDGWEKQKEQERMLNPDGEKKRKPTKKELEIFKARAAEKKRQKRMDWYQAG